MSQEIKQTPLCSTSTFVSSMHFVDGAGGAGWSKFSSLFFLENSITASELAILSCVQSISKFIGYPTFGILADLFGNAKSLMLFSLIMSQSILFLFYYPSTKSMIFSNFYLLLFIRGLRSYCNVIRSLIDAVTMKLIADKKSYGKHRLFSSIAWGFSTLIVGKLIDVYGIHFVFIYGLFWYFILFWLIYYIMPTKVENYTQHEYESLSNFDINDSHEILVDIKKHRHTI
eukprot:495955_1